MPINLYRIPYVGGRKQGPNKWGQEVFGKDNYDKVVREIAQNSTDNPFPKNDDTTVKLSISTFEIDTNEIPSKSVLLDSFESSLKYLESSGYKKGGDVYNRFLNGVELLKNEKIKILKFSDFNTSGLYGSWSDPNSPIYRFCATIGFSIEDGDGGGSRGHGKTAPFNLSGINTCFYASQSSLESGEIQSTYYGCADLVYHEVGDEKYNGEVFFSDFDNKSEYKAITFFSDIEAEEKIPFWMRQRRKDGTDIFIVGFEPEDFNWEDEILRCFMRNFYAAIIDRKLEVSIGDFVLDRESILGEKCLELFDEFDRSDYTMQYIKAYVHGETVTSTLPLLGECSLSIITKENYGRKIDMMRSRRMKINDVRKNTWSGQDFAAVFCCKNSEGSKILRKMEGSTHTKWDHNKIKNGQKYYDEYMSFIKGVIQKYAGSLNGDEEDLIVSDILSGSFGMNRGGNKSGSPDVIETARLNPGVLKQKIKQKIKTGSVIISSKGKIKRKTVVKSKKEPAKNKETHPSTARKKREYRVEDFDFKIIRNEKDRTFDIIINNTGQVEKKIQELQFAIPDESGRTLDLELVTGLTDNSGNNILRKTKNKFGPLTLEVGKNKLKATSNELNVLLMIK